MHIQKLGKTLVFDFSPVWERIVRIDAEPLKVFPYTSRESTNQLAEELDSFANGRPFWADSAEVRPRPRMFENAKQVFGAHSCLEFVAGFEDGTYWAITEEEYDWYIYAGKI